MAEALALARSAKGRTWPNPPVGAVVAQNGLIVGRGFHKGPGQPHAESQALAEAGEKARGATLYVTLEPCNHQGHTAPCAPSVHAAGIRRIVVAMRDPNPTVTGGGCRYLRDRGLMVDCGIMADQALEMIWPFVATDNFTRLYVELKTATSLDGFFAPVPGVRSNREPFFLTGTKSREDVHRRRRRIDVVLVGEGTVRADNPRLDGRLVSGQTDVPQIDPVAAYLDSDLSWAGGFNRDNYLVFAGLGCENSANRQKIEQDGGEVIFCKMAGGQLDLRGVLGELARRDLLTVMVEGGPTVAASFLREGLVDRWVKFTAPIILGEGVSWPINGSGVITGSDRFTLTSTSEMASDLLTVYDRRDFASTLARVTL